MIEYFNYFFNPDHLFNIYPRLMAPRAIGILIAISVTLIIGAYVMKSMSKSVDSLKAKGYIRLYHAGMTVALLNLLYVFFAWQRVIFLGARFWILIIFGIGIVWKLFILRYLYKTVPRQRAEIDRRKDIEKYLPKANR